MSKNLRGSQEPFVISPRLFWSPRHKDLLHISTGRDEYNHIQLFAKRDDPRKALLSTHVSLTFHQEAING